jgi:alcohol dehydrogenase class IV
MIHTQHAQLVGSSIADLAEMLFAMDASRVLLVLDRGAARASGLEPRLLKALDERLVGVFDDFTPNPSSDQPLRAAREARALSADTLVAFGGGSCMDVAKVGALAAGAPDHAQALVRGAGVPGVTPLQVIALPTTSGTGSEATHFSAIYVDGHKVSVSHPGMRPRGVILDVDLHLPMPRFVAATTGLDALCQATESLWASGATRESIAHARNAQSRILPHLVPSVLTASRTSRENLMLGAHAAGHAINISKTTAAHALSYELTTTFALAHGHAVALTLGHVASFNAGLSDQDCTNPAGAAAHQRVREACAPFGVEPGEMPSRLRDLLSQLDLPASLSAAGVSRESLPGMAAAADTVRLSNNPRRLTTQDALDILERAF